jgi:hypothetical protein
MTDTEEFTVYRFRSNRTTEGRVGACALSGPIGIVGREKLSNQKHFDNIFLFTVPA